MSSKNFLIISFLFISVSYNLWRDWRGSRTPFTSDVEEYYSYNMAAFIEKDISFKSSKVTVLKKTPLGYEVPKMSMGLAIAYLPVFLICHTVSIITGSPLNGTNDIYSYGMQFGGIVIVFIGLFYLRKLLLLKFNDTIAFYTLLSIFLGTNLFYYTAGLSLMPHTYLFTIFAIIFYYSLKWYELARPGHLFTVAFFLGLAVLIRPTSIFIILIPLLIGIKNWSDLVKRFLFFKEHYIQILVSAFLFIIPWIPQVLFWKVYTGSYFYYSYGEEGFDFSSPQLINVLFSFRKGWLLYTPIMVFSLVGFYFLYTKVREYFYGITVFFVITFYVLSCWWFWSWGGCFSNRALMESYIFLAFPMASLFSYIQEHKGWRILKYSIFLLVAFNFYQTYRYKAVVIHWDQMSKESYKYGFFKLHFDDKEREEFNKLLKNYKN